MDDTSLAQKAATGDWEALAILVDRHRATLFRVAYGEIGRYEDAQDAVAEAIVRVCKYGSHLRQPEQFGAWLRVLVRNEARRIAKRNARNTIQPELQSVPEGEPETRLQQTVREALAQLPVDYAHVTMRFYWNGESVREIAHAIKRPEGTVKWMLSRSRAQLAELLNEDRVMNTSTRLPYHAVVIAPNLSAAEQQEIRDALKNGGWDFVQVIADASQALARADSRPAFLKGQQLVILDEQVGSANAFELIPLLVAARKQHDFALWLLLREGRSDDAKKVAAMAAYMSGVDFLLTRPFAPGELVAFAKHIQRTLSSKA